MNKSYVKWFLYVYYFKYKLLNSEKFLLKQRHCIVSCTAFEYKNISITSISFEQNLKYIKIKIKM